MGSNEELLMDHEFVSSTFGSVLRDTTLMGPIACETELCACEDIGCSSCGGDAKKKKKGDEDASALIATRRYTPGKTHTKGIELEKLLLNTKKVKLEPVEYAVEEPEQETVECAQPISTEIDEYELAHLRAALPREMWGELGLI